MYDNLIYLFLFNKKCNNTTYMFDSIVGGLLNLVLFIRSKIANVTKLCSYMHHHICFQNMYIFFDNFTISLMTLSDIDPTSWFSSGNPIFSKFLITLDRKKLFSRFLVRHTKDYGILPQPICKCNFKQPDFRQNYFKN